MRVKRKVVSVLMLTPTEIDQLFRLANEAKDGKTVHYSEVETRPGQFFGVSVDERNAYEEYMPTKRDGDRVATKY